MTEQEENLSGSEDDDESKDRACPVCDGDGGDKWNDYATNCPACDGTGYAY